MSARVEAVLNKLGVRYNPEPVRGFLNGHCPVHDDKNPSWHIRVSKHRYAQWHCFSCDAGGTLVDLVMQVKGLKFSAAKEFLAELGGDDSSPEEDAPAQIVVEVDAPDPIFKLPPGVEFGSLETWPTPVRRYVETRHIPSWQVSRWQLGYAVHGRLAGRVVIPVWGGNPPSAFSYMARDYCDGEKRYLYPSSKEHPDLDVLWGEAHWPRTWARRWCDLFVTEGVFNAMAIERALDGASVYLAAVGGRLLRPAHTHKMSTFKNILVFSDNDDAGNGLAEEIRLALARHCTVIRGILPPGVDADDLEPGDLRARCERALASIP